jgi:hypothetical protein
MEAMTHTMRHPDNDQALVEVVTEMRLVMWLIWVHFLELDV